MRYTNTHATNHSRACNRGLHDRDDVCQLGLKSTANPRQQLGSKKPFIEVSAKGDKNVILKTARKPQLEWQTLSRSNSCQSYPKIHWIHHPCDMTDHLSGWFPKAKMDEAVFKCQFKRMFILYSIYAHRKNILKLKNPKRGYRMTTSKRMREGHL